MVEEMNAVKLLHLLHKSATKNVMMLVTRKGKLKLHPHLLHVLVRLYSELIKIFSFDQSFCREQVSPLISSEPYGTNYFFREFERAWML